MAWFGTEVEGNTTVRFPDYSRVIHTDDANYSTNGITPWTATEDCWVVVSLRAKATSLGGQFFVDGIRILYYLDQTLNGTTSSGGLGCIIPVKKGSVISSRTGSTDVTCEVTVYGML